MTPAKSIQLTISISSLDLRQFRFEAVSGRGNPLARLATLRLQAPRLQRRCAYLILSGMYHRCDARLPVAGAPPGPLGRSSVSSSSSSSSTSHIIAFALMAGITSICALCLCVCVARPVLNLSKNTGGTETRCVLPRRFAPRRRPPSVHPIPTPFSVGMPNWLAALQLEPHPGPVPVPRRVTLTCSLTHQRRSQPPFTQVNS